MHTGLFTADSTRPLATLLELHGGHTVSITNSSSYRDDAFKPEGGAWNDYGMRDGTTIYTDTTAGYRDDTTNKLMSEWGAGNGPSRVSSNLGVTRNFRANTLLPSGGEWTTPQRNIDTERTNYIGNQYTDPSDNTFLINFPKDSADTDSTVFEPYSNRVNSVGAVLTNVNTNGPTSFGVSKNYADTRFGMINDANSVNNSWVKFTGNMATDRPADRAANQSGFTTGTALETR